MREGVKEASVPPLCNGKIPLRSTRKGNADEKWPGTGGRGIIFKSKVNSIWMQKDSSKIGKFKPRKD